MRKVIVVAVIAFVLLGINASNAAGPARQATAPTRTAPAVQGQDIEQLAIVVLMQAAQNAQDDLKAIMAQVKANNQAKAKVRQYMSEARNLPPSPCFGATALRDCIRQTRAKLSKMELASLDLMRASVMAAQGYAAQLTDALRHEPEEAERRRKNQPPPARMIPANPCNGWNVAFWKQCLALMRAELTGNLPDTNSQAAIDERLDVLKQDIDALSDLSDTESLRLQMTMDRMSKLMSTLSNILKKISDVSSAIAQNMK